MHTWANQILTITIKNNIMAKIAKSCHLAMTCYFTSWWAFCLFLCFEKKAILWKFIWLLLNCVHCPLAVTVCHMGFHDTYWKKAFTPDSVWSSFRCQEHKDRKEICTMQGATRVSDFCLHKNNLKRFFLIVYREDCPSQFRTQFSWGHHVFRVHGRPDIVIKRYLLVCVGTLHGTVTT